VTIAAAVALVLLAGGGAPATPSLTGTWTWGGEDAEEAGGTLVVIDDAEGTRFQLQLSRGAPSYNMGFLEGRLTVKDGRATFAHVEAGMPCEIAFTFTRGSAVLERIGDDSGCLFGFQVHADGTYRRISRKKPKFDLIPQ
jgi:hypothetical protein